MQLTDALLNMALSMGIVHMARMAKSAALTLGVFLHHIWSFYHRSMLTRVHQAIGDIEAAEGGGGFADDNSTLHAISNILICVEACTVVLSFFVLWLCYIRFRRRKSRDGVASEH